MGAFAAGQVIVVPFPFSDLSAQKYRPALILADAARGDWVLCQITSNPFSDTDAIELNENAFSQGGLQRTSYARPGKLFTANDSLFVAQVGILRVAIFQQVRDAVVAMLRGGRA
ncbi:MAG: type II toxin-antitoxin system PemK/MazF family toxin [Gallionellaceae bacterium]|nr:type II toxin-antitoxin system PemK/MazF family toxin [Gallionellaceae bacterium]